MNRIDEIRARCNAASPGPWFGWRAMGSRGVALMRRVDLAPEDVAALLAEIDRLLAREAELAPLVAACRDTAAAYHATMAEQPGVGEVEDYVRRGIAACDAHGSAVNALADALLAREGA